MAKWIDAEELKNAIHQSYNPYQDYWAATISRMHELIDDQPTVDAVEVVHAYWIERLGSRDELICSNCKTRYRLFRPNYCQYCGAKMDRVDKDICKVTRLECIRCNPGPCEHREEKKDNG